MLTDDQNKEFGEKFVKRFMAHGFGSMTKSELDILVFHLLSCAEEIEDKSNYHVANKLQITEARVKSLRLNAALKYKQANHKAVLANIVTRIEYSRVIRTVIPFQSGHLFHWNPDTHSI